MFNVRRNRESNEQKTVGTESVPAIDVETVEEGVVENRQMKDENVSLLRREDMQQPARPGQGGALLGRGCRFDGKLTFEGTVQIDGEFIGSDANGTLGHIKPLRRKLRLAIGKGAFPGVPHAEFGDVATPNGHIHDFEVSTTTLT